MAGSAIFIFTIMNRILLLSVLSLALVSCQQSSIDPAATAVVKDVRIPKGMPWYSRFATHSYVDFRSKPSEPWQRIEIVNKDSGLILEPVSEEEVHASSRWGNPVHLVSQSKHDGQVLASQITAFGKGYNDTVYKAWPGPNSNTFTDGLLREVDGLSGVLEHNGVGKDASWRAGTTAGGTGLEIQSPLLGAEAGLKEGLNINFMGLTAGIGVWPPAIKLPFLPQFPLRSELKDPSSQR